MSIQAKLNQIISDTVNAETKGIINQSDIKLTYIATGEVHVEFWSARPEETAEINGVSIESDNLNILLSNFSKENQGALDDFGVKEVLGFNYTISVKIDINGFKKTVYIADINEKDFN